MTNLEIIPSVGDRFSHILSAINIIQDELRGTSERELVNNLRRRLALERLFEIVSIASNHIPAEIKAAEPMVDWRCLAEIGLRLENPRDRIEPEVLWSMACGKLVQLRACAERRIQA